MSNLIGGIPSGLSELSICFKKSIFFFEARKMIAWSAHISSVSESSYPNNHVWVDVDFEYT